MNKKAYLITNIGEYGKLISFCIEHDINVFRTYWDERDSDRCYYINWEEKRCYFSSWNYYENNDYEIVVPVFELNEYGKYNIVKEWKV